MSEGPVNFGKPLLYITIVACIGGGYWTWTHWPVTYQGDNWYVNMPHGWEAGPANDPADPGKIQGAGPLPKSPDGQEQTGVIWMKVVIHGTLDWNMYINNNIPGTPDWTNDDDIDYKHSRQIMYEDQTTRYYGALVDRGDALVIVAIGTNKTYFEMQKPIFEKVIRSIRCQR
jgi:hypothetical protein